MDGGAGREEEGLEKGGGGGRLLSFGHSSSCDCANFVQNMFPHPSSRAQERRNTYEAGEEKLVEFFFSPCFLHFEDDISKESTTVCAPDQCCCYVYVLGKM